MFLLNAKRQDRADIGRQAMVGGLPAYKFKPINPANTKNVLIYRPGSTLQADLYRWHHL